MFFKLSIFQSGAESGWDYSTRWFFKEDGNTPSTDLLDIQTRHIIPVDLNSYLCKNAQILSKFHGLLGQESKAQQYERIFDKFTDAIDHVLWNEDKGAWFDFKTKDGKQNLQFYPSNLAPLWANCYQQNRLLQKIIPVINYVEKLKAFDYPGGVPTSMVKSGQQWDFRYNISNHRSNLTGIDHFFVFAPSHFIFTRFSDR